jgi:DNA polymerase III subunit gamma/tau
MPSLAKHYNAPAAFHLPHGRHPQTASVRWCGVSLYRTWRPRSFADLVGQDAVVRTLSTALSSGKLAHAYLFSGPRGSGKTSAAKILARCIDCVHGPTPTPDNTCENCRAILAGTALDVLEIDAASYRGIDGIREIRDAVKFAPASMRAKVYIIDEAHMLTKEGANAFLKTLEEPPDWAVFILATTEPEKLPVTILSRCQRYAFRRIPVPVTIERLRYIAGEEGIDIEDDALAAIAYRSEGGLRDALTMLEQAAAFAGGGRITAHSLDVAFGTSGREVAQTLVDAVATKDAAVALETIDAAADGGIDMLVLMRLLLAALRNVLVARVDPELLERDLAPEDAARAAERAGTVPQSLLVRALRVLTDSIALARSGGNARLELETALLRIVLAGEDPTLDALAARVAALEQQPGDPSIPRPEPAVRPEPAARPEPAPRRAPVVRPEHSAQTKSAPPQAPTQADTRPVKRRDPGDPLTLQLAAAAWPSVRTKVESEYAPLRGPLSSARVVGVDGNVVHVQLPSETAASIVRDRLALIEAAARDVLGAPVSVKLRVASAATPGTATSGNAPATGAASEPDDDSEALFSYLSERIPER